MDTKSINIENLKDFIKNILPKYITNKDVLDKLSIDKSSNMLSIDNIPIINDKNISNLSTYS